ncbi:MAG: class I SAM-dependent RNA methyltransferase [Clostridia bacterium]|nr:class I SAM-dependent RNA methyltransferase [Clostridia bacterium]
MINRNQMQWFATAAFGLEGVVSNELKRLGFDQAKAELGGARFTASPEEAYRAMLWLRSADRLLLVIKEGVAKTFEELFQLVKSVPWEEYLPRDARFPVSGKCARSQLMSVRDCQAITKKAIVERLKSAYRQEWFQETGAVYPIDVSLHGDTARLTLDFSGEALNRRGYRTWNGEAPLRETLAAALIQLSPWRPGMSIYDPCCGTGTLLIEGALIASRRAPGLNRTFACESFTLMDKATMEAIRDDARQAFDPARLPSIEGSDISPDALGLAKKHIVQAGLSNRILVHQEDLRTVQRPEEQGVFMVNPPYGERIGDRKSCEKLYKELGLLLRRHPGWSMGVIASQPDFERHFGRRATKKRRLYNGRLECEFMIFSPSKK